MKYFQWIKGVKFFQLTTACFKNFPHTILQLLHVLKNVNSWFIISNLFLFQTWPEIASKILRAQRRRAAALAAPPRSAIVPATCATEQRRPLDPSPFSPSPSPLLSHGCWPSKRTNHTIMPSLSIWVHITDVVKGKIFVVVHLKVNIVVCEKTNLNWTF